MKIYELSDFKADFPASYKQIKYLLSFNNVTCKRSVSQLMKRLERHEASELIELAKEGEEIEIK